MDHPKFEALKKAWHEKRSVTMVYILLRLSRFGHAGADF